MSLNQNPPSRTVDYHALRILVTHLSTADVDFLSRSLGSPRINLDDLRTSLEPTFFSRMLWALALGRLWPGPTLRQVEYFVRNSSFTMELDLACAPECTYYAEDPTPSLTRLLRLGGDVFYDIGANVGFHSLSGSMFFGESHAFEPTPQTLVRIQKNVGLNPGREVTVHGVALSSQDGHATLLVDEVHPGGNSLVAPSQGAQQSTVHVPTFRLDTYRRTHNLPGPNVIKIDVEGHEYDVLVGAENTVDSFRPTIFVEVQNTDILERFVKRLPSSYESYILPTNGPPVPAALRAKLGRHRDILFVDGPKRALLERGLLDSWIPRPQA